MEQVSTNNNNQSEGLAQGEDEIPLKLKLKRAERMRKYRAMALIAPLFLFILGVFAIPIAIMMWRAIDNPEVVDNLPQTAIELSNWDGESTPTTALTTAFASDLVKAYEDKTASTVAKRLNYDVSGMRSLVTRTARKFNSTQPEMATMDDFIKADKRWADLRYWQALKRASSSLTPFYVLNAFDMKINDEGQITSVPEGQAIYTNIFWRTMWIAGVVTVGSLLIGFPIAYLLANTSSKVSNLLMFCVLLPFWTSLLVRTSAWVVLLQKNGVVNSTLINLGLINEPMTLLFARPGVYIAFLHLLVPFVVLPLYSVMTSISPAYMRAAESLGAHPAIAFVRVYLPQTLPGIGAGGILAFILAIGYYITPALIGGPQDQMLSYFIANHANSTLNWGLASALGMVLLVTTMILFSIYNRLTGASGVKMG
ncbi:ABC transporter permease [Terasakiella pusilla]|uniref:ABC transporter permease n=1 Tax=Terasakiella pusilla TaxID=64973 RepID=UPI003AA9693A